MGSKVPEGALELSFSFFALGKLASGARLGNAYAHAHDTFKKGPCNPEHF